MSRPNEIIIENENMDNLYAKLGLSIKKFREAAGLSKTALAEGICDKSFITLIESGKRCPNGIILLLLCARLQIPTQMLYQTLYKYYIEEDYYNEMLIFSSLKRMDFINTSEIVSLNKNFIPTFIHYQYIISGGDILVNSLKVQEFEEHKKDFIKTVPQIEDFLNHENPDVFSGPLGHYDTLSISDYILLSIFANQSDLVYGSFEKYLQYLDKQIIANADIVQFKIMLKFEMALVCNDLGKFTESRKYIDSAIQESQEFTLSGVIPHLYYAKGETFWLLGEKEIGAEYMRKAFELHRILAPKRDDFLIIKMRLKQKGIAINIK